MRHMIELLGDLRGHDIDVVVARNREERIRVFDSRALEHVLVDAHPCDREAVCAAFQLRKAFFVRVDHDHVVTFVGKRLD